MAQRSAHPARQLAPREELTWSATGAAPDLRRDLHPDLHLEAARHAPVRPALSELRLREASLVPCFRPQEAWPPELAQVVPGCAWRALCTSQAGCLFGAYPQAASARLGQSEQQARSSPPEVSAEACVRVVPRSEELAVAQPLVERLWAVPASDAAAARQQAAEVAASDAAVVPRQAAEVAVLVAAAGPQQAAEAAVLDVAAEPQQAVEAAVSDAAAGPQQVAVAAVPGVAAEPRPEAVLDAAVLLPAAQGVQAAATAGGFLGFPSGPTSSLACATTSGAVCACDAETANCVTVRAVVASSTMRRFVMMFLVPGKFLAARKSGFHRAFGRSING